MNHSKNQFKHFLHELDVWSCSQSKVEHDWSESFPHIGKLVDVACQVAACINPNESVQSDLDNIARVVSLTDESEKAVENLVENCVSLQVLKLIAAAGDWKCRWQIYSHVVLSNELAEQVVYLGTWDSHAYVARRAYLNLMTSSNSELLTEATYRLSGHDDMTLSGIAKKFKQYRSGQKLIDENDD